MNIKELQTKFRGEILTAESARYDAARRLWNGMIDRRPAAIACCLAPEDVVAAVKFAVSQDIFPAIRAGGHNVAGVASADDGFVIDVTGMKNIVVDVAAATATAQTGLTWGEFDQATQAHGLATTGGVITSTGIAGLTLGGGVGLLMGRCGFVCDNVLSLDLVTASGELVTANADQHPDLFWALRGGGGNFGVVTSITYRLYPIATVVSGIILYPLAQGPQVLGGFRDFVAAGLPDELTVYAVALRTPDGAVCIAILPAYCGADLDEGERLIAPLKQLGTPVADLVGRMPYLALQKMLEASAPYGIRSYWKSTYLRALPDDAIEVFLQFVESSPSPRSAIILEHAHGAPMRVAPGATAFAMRNEGLDLVIMGLWEDPKEDASNIQWARDFFAAMEPNAAGAVYVNTLGEDENSRIPEAYGQNYDRLRDVKRRYDPQNRFRRNHNIRP